MDKSGLMFPKPGKKKKRRQHSKSIIQNKEDKKCYLCILLEDNWTTYTYLEEHHIFFSKHQRAVSERYGLKVYLCSYHHRIGPLAVHNNQKYRRLLEAKGQQAFEALYGHERFMEVFGENYT
ncbi:MAG: hypothetical protein HFI26_08425 [Lachnospiraceae bacterium]|jgi:hypothetical protein|nr:hypothetical protein [Lachnospiraceae bacterium]